MAVLPSPESDTELPWYADKAPLPTSLAPCWVHTPPDRVYTQAASARLSSPGPPTMAVFPSPDSEMDRPCSDAPTAPVPTSFACWLHTPSARVYTHAAPALLSSRNPPTIAVFPSPESATDTPCDGCKLRAPVPTSFAC